MIRHFCDCCNRECPPYKPWSRTDDTLDHWVITMTPPVPHPDFYELNHNPHPGRQRTQEEAYFLTHQPTATLDICGVCAKRAGLLGRDDVYPFTPLWVEAAPDLIVEAIKERAAKTETNL